MHIVHLPRHEPPSTVCNMRLAEIRQARGLSQQQLGEMIGRAASTIQRAEVMAKTAKLETYQLCAAALGVSLAEIFADHADEALIILAYRSASPDARAMILGMAERAAALPAPSPAPASEADEAGDQ